MKNSVKALKRSCALLLAILMTVTSFPLNINADDIIAESSDIIVEADDATDVYNTDVEIEDETLENDSFIVGTDESENSELLSTETYKTVSVSFNSTYVNSFRCNPKTIYPYNDANHTISCQGYDNATIDFSLVPGAYVSKVEIGYEDESGDSNNLCYKSIEFEPSEYGYTSEEFSLGELIVGQDDDGGVDYRKVREIRITAGPKAEIKFESGYKFEHVSCINGEYYPLSNDEKNFEHTQEYIEGEEVYVAVYPYSNSYKLVEVDENNNSFDIPMVDFWELRNGVCQIYKITAKNNTIICGSGDLSNEAKTVVFENKASSLLYDVTTDDHIVSISENTFNVSKDGILKFVVHKSTSTKAASLNNVIVKYEVGDGKYIEIPYEDMQRVIRGEDYFYSLKYTDLLAENKIVIDWGSDKCITFEYPEDRIDSLKVKVNGKLIDPIYKHSLRGKVTEEYSVGLAAGTEYSIVSKDKYVVGCIKEIRLNDNRPGVSDGYSKLLNYKKSSYSKFLYMWDNYNVSIEPEGIIYTSLEIQKADGEWELVPDNKKYRTGHYEVASNSKYRVTVYQGEGLLKGKGPELGYLGAYVNNQRVLNIVDNKNPYVFETGNVDTGVSSSAGFNIDYNDDGVKSHGKIFGIYINVIGMPKELYLKDSGATIDCQIDAKQWIRFYSKNTGGSIFRSFRDFPNYAVEVNYLNGSNENDIIVELNPIMGLYVTTTANDINKLGEIAEIKLHRIDRNSGDSDYYMPIIDKDGNRNDKITIRAIEPLGLLNYEVDVKKLKTDDTSVYLQFTQKYDSPVKRPVNGAQYYEIKAVPIQNTNVDMPAEVVNKTIYIKRDINSETEYFDNQYEIQLAEYDKKYGSIEDSTKLPDFEPKYKDYIISQRVKVSDAPDYYGHAWDYNITVSLVQTKNKNIELDESNASSQILFRSKPLKMQMSTMAATYETNLKLSKSVSRLFTGQQNIKTAKITYSSSTGSRGATVKDITECLESKKLELYIKDDMVYSNVSDECLVGKHTIEVTPVGPDTMYKQPKTLEVNVVQGIKELSISVPTKQLFQKNTGSASVSATVTYNKNLLAPAVKKVSWELLEDNNDVRLENSYITISNGKVTVKKGASADCSPAFRIKATAADYAGNTVCAISEPITVSNVATSVGKIVLVKHNMESDCYEIIDKSDSIISEYTTKELEEVRLLALRYEPAEEKNIFTASELENIAIDKDQIKVTSGSNKVAEIKEDDIGYKILARSTAKSLAFNVVTTDGGNKKYIKKIKIVEAKPDSLELIAKISENVIAPEGTRDWNYRGTFGTVINLQVRQKNMGDTDWCDLNSITKHSVSVKGAKIIKKDVNKGQYSIVISGDKAKVTLVDHNNIKTVYNINNLSYSSNNAPKVSIVNNGIVTGSTQGRKINLSVLAKEPYRLEGKVAKIETDAELGMNVKNSSMYEAFNNSCAELKQLNAASASMSLNFDETDLKIGTYKVWITFGTVTDGSFVADTKPVAINIKVVKPNIKKGSYSIEPSVKLYKIKGSSEKIKGKGRNYVISSVSVNSVYNCNIKGIQNNFSKYFDIVTTEEDGIYITQIKLKDNLSDEELSYILDKKGQNDRYCQVVYTYLHGDDGYGVHYQVTKTTKVEIKFIK